MSVIVSIIIPNLNNEYRLYTCLKAIQLQDYPVDQREVIVVDNGSSDNSVSITRGFEVKLIIEDTIKSPYKCRNSGIRAAKGDIIVLLDSNCIPSVPKWLSSGVNTLGNNERSIVTGPVVFELNSMSGFWEKLDYLYSVITKEEIDYVKALPATQLFIPKLCFDEIGLFVPHVRSLGDIEWTQRATNAGISLLFEDKASVSYPPKKFNSFRKKMIRLGRGKKEIWINNGKSLLNLNWIGMVFKQILPPSLKFVKKMQNLNQREKMNLTKCSLMLGLWCLKLFRLWGMLSKSPLTLPRKSE